MARTNRLILLCGESCQGKTHIAHQLHKKYGFYIIYTDSFYYPLNGLRPNSIVGVRDEAKTAYIRQFIPHLTETTIIDGSPMGNKAEVDIWTSELNVKNAYNFRVKSPNYLANFLTKHPKEELWEIYNWYESIHDYDSVIIQNVDDIERFLNLK